MTDNALTFGSLFAGIGGFDLGFERAGMVCRWQVEIAKHCRQVLARHWPDMPRYGDVKNVGRENLGSVDIICGGFPCQDVSVAGRREGLAGERSGLWFEFLRVIAELKPEWVVIENVPGLLSSYSGNDPPGDLQPGREWKTTEESSMGIVLRGLAECGYWWAYRVLDLQFFGVPQRRRRVFIVASLTRGRPQQVLFERQSSPWDTAPGRKAGERSAAPIKANAPSRRNGGSEPIVDEFVLPFDTTQITSPVNRSQPKLGNPCHPLAEQAHPPAIVYGGNNTAGSIDVAPARNAHDSNRYDFESEAFIFESRYARCGRGAPDTTVSPLKAESGTTGKGDGAPLVAYNWQSGGDVRHSFGLPNLQANQVPAVGVRRLTPLECERLQGFPDGHTDGQNDSTRYRQLGNAVGVPHSEWIGKRIVEVANA